MLFQITEAVVRLVNILQREESEHTIQDAEAAAEENGTEQAVVKRDNNSAGNGGGKLLGEIDVGAERPPGTAEEEEEGSGIVRPPTIPAD